MLSGIFPVVYGLVGGALGGLIIGLCIRRGLCLYSKTKMISIYHEGHKVPYFLPILMILVVYVVIVGITKRWLSIIVGGVIGLVVWSIFYFSPTRNSRHSGTINKNGIRKGREK